MSSPSDHDKAPADPAAEGAAEEAKTEGWQTFQEGCYEAGKATREIGSEAGAAAVVAGQHLAEAGKTLGAAGASAGRVVLEEGRAAGAVIAERMEGAGEAARLLGHDVGQVLVDKGGEALAAGSI